MVKNPYSYIIILKINVKKIEKKKIYRLIYV